MRDCDVRRALHDELRHEHESELDKTRFVDELGVCGEVRVDVAVLNGAFSGYELKSEADSLRRLPKQIEFYSKVLDFAVLVVAEKHAAKAVKIIPDWWGFTVASGDAGCVKLSTRRAPGENPSIDPGSLALLLWRDEALAELTLRGMDRGVRSKSRSAICARLAAQLSLDELRAVVREQLKSRQGWRSDR